MKRSSQATGHGHSPTREAPAGGLAQPDERDLSIDGQGTSRKSIGPRQIIQQAARDIARGLEDTDRHGIPNNVPGPTSQQAAAEPMVAEAGNKRTYADDQSAPGPDKPAGGTRSGRR